MKTIKARVVLKSTTLLFLCVRSVVSSVSSAPGCRPEDAFTPEEIAIQREIMSVMNNVDGVAYIVSGTLLYLYKPLNSQYINFNSLGFRGSEVTPKGKNGFNIMVMGGSTVVGHSQADHQTIPAYVEECLRAPSGPGCHRVQSRDFRI